LASLHKRLLDDTVVAVMSVWLDV